MFISTEVFHQTLAVIPIICNEISMGFSYGWVSPTLRQQQQQGANAEFSLDNEQCSWIGSLHEFGRMFGPFVAAPLIDKGGRRLTLIICTIVFFATWPALIFTRSVPVIYAMRFLFGLAVGLNDVCSSIYIGENCTPKLRAIFGSVCMAAFYGGELVEFAIVTFLPYGTVAVVNTILTGSALSCILFATETPHYLITRQQLAKAEHTFNWLRGKRGDSGGDGGSGGGGDEFQSLKKFLEQESGHKVRLSQLFTDSVYYRPTLLILTLCVLMMMTGFSAVNAFVSIAFTASETLTANQFTTLYGAFQFATVCVSPFLIEKFRRRTILLTSFGCVAAAHLSTAAIYWATSHGYRVPHSSWLLFATITLYAMCFSFGLHTIFYTVRGELFPQQIKAIGGCVAIVGHSIMGFLTSKMFLIAADTFGMYANFLVFGLSSVAAMLFVYRCIPETKGKTLAEIQEELRKR